MLDSIMTDSGVPVIIAIVVLVIGVYMMLHGDGGVEQASETPEPPAPPEPQQVQGDVDPFQSAQGAPTSSDSGGSSSGGEQDPFQAPS